MSEHWSNPYIGLPWREKGRDRNGVDCWGIARLPLLEIKGVETPDYSGGYVSVAAREELARLFADTRASPWRPIERNKEEAFDIVVFARAGFETHVGLVVEPGRMLHVEAHGESHITGYRDGRWNRRLAGFYRHDALA
jgi:probable lipoprotein NlpC